MLFWGTHFNLSEINVMQEQQDRPFGRETPGWRPSGSAEPRKEGAGWLTTEEHP